MIQVDRCRRLAWAGQSLRKLFGSIFLAVVFLILTGSGFVHGGNAKYIILL